MRRSGPDTCAPLTIPARTSGRYPRAPPFFRARRTTSPLAPRPSDDKIRVDRAAFATMSTPASSSNATISPRRGWPARWFALLNLEGGHILLGVEDDGSVSGLNRERGKGRGVGHGDGPNPHTAGRDPLLGDRQLGWGEGGRYRVAVGGRPGQALQGEARLGLGDQGTGRNDDPRRDPRGRGTSLPAERADSIRAEARSRGWSRHPRLASFAGLLRPCPGWRRA